MLPSSSIEKLPLMSFDTNDCKHTNAIVTDVRSPLARMSKGSISVRCNDCGQIGIRHGRGKESCIPWISVAIEDYEKAQVLNPT